MEFNFLAISNFLKKPVKFTTFYCNLADLMLKETNQIKLKKMDPFPILSSFMFHTTILGLYSEHCAAILF